MRAPIHDRLQIKVRISAAHYTARAEGYTSGSHLNQASAVKKLTVMIWGEGNHGMAHLRQYAPGVELWEIVKEAK